MAVIMKTSALWDVPICSLIDRTDGFGEICRVHLQDNLKWGKACSSDRLVPVHTTTQCHNREDRNYHISVNIKNNTFIHTPAQISIYIYVWHFSDYRGHRKMSHGWWGDNTLRFSLYVYCCIPLQSLCPMLTSQKSLSLAKIIMCLSLLTFV
jgi:hypothetical protein